MGRVRSGTISRPSGRGLLLHILVLAALVSVLLTVYALSKPRGPSWIEAEDFKTEGWGWAYLEDVNFSKSRGLMSSEAGLVARAVFEAQESGRYAIWIKYFGNYSPGSDLGLWERAYTNSFRYLDLNRAIAPQTASVKVDNGPGIEFEQGGSHRYRWAKTELELLKGKHVISIEKAKDSAGSINFDGVLITEDLSYKPGVALPRQASEIAAPLIIAAFPLLVWLLSRGGGGRPAVYLWYSFLLSAALSVMWIDTDGGFWIWLTQSKEFTLSSIYTKGDALHHRYVYPPPIALMLIALRPVFSLFGAMDGITPAALLLSKVIVIPFIVLTGVLLYRLEGVKALFLWALSPIVLFTAAANSMYFGLAFFLTLAVFYIKKERHYSGAFAFGLAMAYMSAAALLLPPFLLLLRRFHLRKAVILALFAVVPASLVLLPYQFIDPAGVNARVIGAGIATWISMHLGIRMGGLGVTTLMYGALLAYIWIKKPVFDHLTISAVFALSALIYLNIGAPYFLAWTVAFQPFIIILASRLKMEVFYSLYITALMVWGSFFINTGGADDRAGETGFFPFYTFYTWPFDAYAVAEKIYSKAHIFSRPDIEALTHSLSAGISLVLFFVILSRAFSGEGMK